MISYPESNKKVPTDSSGRTTIILSIAIPRQVLRSGLQPAVFRIRYKTVINHSFYIISQTFAVVKLFAENSHIIDILYIKFTYLLIVN